MATGNYGRWRTGAIVLAVALAAFVLWNVITGWAPSRQDYPVQGMIVNEDNGAIFWPTMGATGVDFAYLTATYGTKRRDRRFAANLEGVREAGIRYGALHIFDICKLATDQATLFITSVPRLQGALPPAVELGFSENCSSRPDRALILSELSTFLSQIEAHSGVPAVLLLSQDFEEEYKISSAVDRNVWLERNWLLPDYAAKPWVMWTANDGRRISEVEGSVRWAAVRP